MRMDDDHINDEDDAHKSDDLKSHIITFAFSKKIFFYFIRTSPLYPSDLKLPSPGAPEFINFPKALVSVVFLRKYFTGLVLRVFDNLISSCNHVRQTMK